MRFAGILIAAAQIFAQTQPASLSRVIGDVTAIDTSARQITTKTDQGDQVAVRLDDKTVYLRVAPGEKDLKNATRIGLNEIAAGDRIYARGKMSEDKKSIEAASVIVMTKSALAEKHERDRAEWQKRGIAGTVTAVNASTGEFTLSPRPPGSSPIITVQTGKDARFRRYGPSSKFADAKPSSLAELKSGDHVRVLGDKNDTGDRIKAEEVVFGSFRTIGGLVANVNPAAHEVTIQDLQTKKPVSVTITEDSMVRRLPLQMAQMMAHRLEARRPGGPPGSTAERTSGPPPGGAPAPGSGPPGGPPGAGYGPPGGPGAGGGRMGRGDMQQMLERMPPVDIADLKPGEAVIVTSTDTSTASHVTAIAVVAGVEPLFTAAPPRAGGPDLGGTWNFGEIGLPQ